MKKLTVFALVAVLLVSVFAFSACQQNPSTEPELKVGIVCIGSTDDFQTLHLIVRNNQWSLFYRVPFMDVAIIKTEEGEVYVVENIFFELLFGTIGKEYVG